MLAAFDFAIPFLLITVGEQRISSSLAGILVATVPLLIALFAIRLDHAERVMGHRLVGLFVGLAGVVLLLGVEIRADAAIALGAGLVLLASVNYTLATLWLKRAFAGVDSIAIVTGALIASTVMLAPAPLLSGRGLAGFEATADVVAALVALGVFCTAAAYVTFYALVAEVGPSRASINTYISPAIAVALGVALLDEPLTAGAVAGLLMILVGSWAATGGPPGKAEKVRRGPAAEPSSS